MKTTKLVLTVVSSMFFAALGASVAGPAVAAPVAQAPAPPAPPTPPNVVGASGEGVVQRAGAKYLLRGDDGSIVFELRDAAAMANAHAAIALHEGQRVAVTGVVLGRQQGVALLQIGSLVVTRGGEFDKVISTIASLRCPDVVFGVRDSYRLDANHTTGDARFQVYVGAGGASYLVWIRRERGGFGVDNVLRFQGKAAVPACVKP